MTLQQRIDYLTYVFNLLQNTNSRTEKEQIVNNIDQNCKEDFDFIIECLAGKHKFGYTYKRYPFLYNSTICSMSVKSVLQFLLTPAKEKDLSTENIASYVSLTTNWAYFFEPIVNRTLKLGIGRSLLPLSETSPMLAKKFDDKTYDKLDKFDSYYLTEKLDGNRCIAYHDGIEWNFVSRNGKQMYVKFDMSQFPESMIFDGEVMSKTQTLSSIRRNTSNILENNTYDMSSTKDFSEASGLINTHSYNKDVIYNIFDIVDNFSTYEQRRHILSQFKNTKDVRILPIIDVVSYKNLFELASTHLNRITSAGGEGIMINSGHSKYQHKRVNDLLKFKKMYTMDLRVVGLIGGTGKYEGMIGALQCIGEYEDKLIAVDVGTGLSDTQRWDWAVNDDEIIGKIVEVGYFSLSQEKGFVGTKHYSLRFPRLIRVREDKSDTNLEI